MTDALLKEVSVYFRHVGALLLPGVDAGEFTVHRTEPADVSEWEPDELRLLVEEGRKQLDRQRTEQERVQTRAQYLFTTAAALLAVFVSQTDHLNSLALIGWAVGLVVLTLGLLGAAALMSVRAQFGGIDASLLSHQQPGSVLVRLAGAYASAVRTGENTIATRITVFRDAVFLVLAGAALHAGIWLYTA